MTDHSYRGPAAWMRDNAFIVILAGAVAVALIGDRVARSGINPADNPQFAQAKPAEAPAEPADANQKAETPPPAEAASPQQQAETPAAPPADGTAANGGSAQEGVSTSQPEAPAADSKAPPKPAENAAQNPEPAPNAAGEQKQ